VVDPAATPVTTPVVGSTDAVPEAALDQLPPVVALAKVVVNPAQTDVVPVMAAGAVFTVIDDVAALQTPPTL
jgi:hypothetical protein